MAKGHGSKTWAEQGAVIRPWTLASTNESVGSTSAAVSSTEVGSNVSPDTIFGTVREIGNHGAESKPESKSDALMAARILRIP